MRITRIAIVLVLGIVLVSGLACGDDGEPSPTPAPTRQVRSCIEAYEVLDEYLDSLPQSSSGAVAASNYYDALSWGYRDCVALGTDESPVEEDEPGEIYCFIIEDNIAVTVEGEPLWEMLPDYEANTAECVWYVFSQDGSVVHWNANAARVQEEMMK